ncbi:chaperone protein dnaJ C76, chloroplastic [Abrus precatorius]|uniref:Chaperone protein dnaJ C76, chloroplastic n=1 Tax=Abrus precatorius TaxID=3816 RepID=A0A8B8LW00_ABRPR|nr:chaperone protein dnaJ C76, chloroplastic [Abrus precatorius]
MSYPFPLPSSTQTHSMNMATAASACLPSYTCSIIRTNLTPLGLFYPSNLLNKSCSKSNGFSSALTCKASSSSSSSTPDFDLYDLLGIDSSSDQSQVKMAYRSLQKRCHPDIAGPAGHDMAIILNEAYAILSDPNARLAYDKEQAKSSEFKGFTGRPIYSVWCGSESEQRAIFVDEIKCVGCLKCALLAGKTFAIESVYGRARVVAQWADSKQKIEEAIESCPVNCISVVERSNLAALEFLMSKQPRGNVRVGAGNTAGARVSNIFVDVEKFQTRFQETMEKASRCSKETDLQRESRMSAIQAIRSISNWLYWQSPSASGSSSKSEKSMTRVVYKLPEPDIGKLRDAAARKKVRERTGTNHQTQLNTIHPEEYWTPSTYVLPSSTRSNATQTPAEKPSVTTGQKKTDERDIDTYENENSPIRWGLPMLTALTAVATVRLHAVELTPELKQHVGGSLALEIVNSSWLQCVLAAATWYMIGLAIVDLVAIFGNKNR